MKNKFVKFNFRNVKGTLLPFGVMIFTALIPLCGLAVDISYFGILRSSLDKATEAAAVSGAQDYFRSKADAGRAVDSTLKVFKMNVSSDTMTGNFHNPTGMGQLSTYTYSKTFTQSDGLSTLFRGNPVSVTVMTDLNRGKVSVTSELTPKPFFAYFLSDNARIKITKEAELPPYDIVFVVDLSGSMRFATVKTYIGIADREITGRPATRRRLTDVILFQSQNGFGGTINANGYTTTIRGITDVLVNSPGFDIPTNATYSTRKAIYINNPDRGFITNTDRSTGLRRTTLTGYTVSELMGLNIPNEDKQLAQTFSDNRSLDVTAFNNYFNRSSGYVEPFVSASYGVMAFIDTVKIYGTAALKVGLATFESSSTTNDRSRIWTNSDLTATTIAKRIRTTYPALRLVGPSEFNTIVTRLTIMSMGGNGSLVSPISTDSYPDGGTNINGGLDSGKSILDLSDRPGSEKVIILFTDGEPSHSFSSLGTKVKSLTDRGIKIYSVVLTLAISQATIDQFRAQVEGVGKAEPVIFISDPARLKDAFVQIADELGLKLTN